MNLAPVGIWTPALDSVPNSEGEALVQELEALGYGAIWFPEAVGRGALVASTLALRATERLVVGTSVATVYARSPIAANSGVRTIEAAFPDRFVFGLGVSHEPMVEGMHHTEYRPPLTAMRNYLDAMDAAPFMAYGGGTKPKRVLAALGPKMLALSAERADGANPYNVTPDHTKHAREILGPDKLLIVEQMAVLTTDREAALAVARQALAIYLTLPNYVNSWRRQGFGDDDFADGGSTRLLDATVVGGDEAAIAARVQEHRDAGADHVAVQVLGREAYRGLPADDWRRLAPALTS